MNQESKESRSWSFFFVMFSKNQVRSDDEKKDIAENIKEPEYVLQEDLSN